MKDPIRELIYKLPPKIRPAIVIFGGMLIQLTLGTVYTFGNIVPYIVSYMRKNVDPNLTVKSMLFVASFEGGFPFSYIVGGLLERKFGPRATALFGCSLVTSATFLSYFAIQNSFVAVLFTVGILFGIGTGITYNVALVCAMKWLPNNIGLASGLIVAGFGCGAFMFSPIETQFVNPWNHAPNAEGYFTQPELLKRVPYMFILLGGIFVCMELLGCLLLCSPKETDNDETDELLVEEEEDNDDSVGPKGMLRSFTFYWLFFSFAFTTPVTSVVAYYKSFGESFIDDDEFLAWVASISSIFNAGGRIFWGMVADKTSYQTAMSIVSMGLCFLMLTLISTTLGGKIQFMIWVCLILGFYSGNYPIFPMATSKCFGAQTVGINYGFVILSQFVAGLLTSTLADVLLGKIGFAGLWLICSAATFATFLLTTTIHRTKYGKGIE